MATEQNSIVLFPWDTEGMDLVNRRSHTNTHTQTKTQANVIQLNDKVALIEMFELGREMKNIKSR